MSNKKIYVISNGNFLKIGISSHPDKRLKELQTGSPIDLKIIKTFNGDLSIEKSIHKDLEKYKTIGGGKEWFYNNEKVLSIVDSYAKSKNPKIFKEEIIDKLTCKKCHGKMVHRVSRTANVFMGCSNFPRCKYTEEIIYDHYKKCELCKDGYMVDKRGHSGKFMGCSNFPKCKHTKKYSPKVIRKKKEK